MSMLWGRRFNRILAVALGLFVIAWLVWLRSFRPLSLGLGLLLWVYGLGIGLVLEWAGLHLLRRGAPALPFGPERWSGRRATLFVLLILVGAVTLLREGLLAPTFVLNMSWHTTRTRIDKQSSTNVSSTSLGGTARRLSGRYVDCGLLGCGSGALCAAFKRYFRCDNDDPKRRRPASVVLVSGTVSFPADPFCYVPLWKSAEIPLSTLITASGADKNATLQLSGSITMSLTGLVSCFEFRRAIGREAAELVARELNSLLQKN